MSRTAFAIVTSLVLAAPLAAQSHPLVGTWRVSYAAGARMGPEGSELIEGKGVLVLEAKGDSLIGTLTQEAFNDMPARPPMRLAALARSGPVTFETRNTAHLNLNGEDREATSVSTWVLDAKGDTLSGTVARRIEGVDDLGLPPMPASPVKGTRTES